MGGTTTEGDNVTAYYNEIDEYAAQWLRNLIAAGHIAPGEVDTRSIEDVHPADLEDFTQCHFFAGIGVWSLALRRAGWPDDRSVWTGSCPCQPFSAAGKGAGFADERHLWPHFHWLIGERRPSVVLGEQVASKDADPWVDLVHADLEGLGYAFGCVPFPSAGIGAPHIRDRNYWVAHATQRGRREERAHSGRYVGGNRPQGFATGSVSGGDVGGLAHARGSRLQELGGGWVESSGLATAGFWRDADWLPCLDGRRRPVEPGSFPLVNGTPARVGRLRAYGNAINAEAARVFIECVMECQP
jgi:DNA (cytosine-5)-methyltransferase 1